MKELETERLFLRRLTPGDAGFVLELLNDPDWLRFIGDRGVRTLEDARDYIVKGPMEMYAQFGLGLLLVEMKEGHAPAGICGLIRRESLEDVDLGFAFLPAFRGKGFAYESAAAALAYGVGVLRLPRIVAITSPENDRSAKLLEKLGFRFEKMIRLSGETEDARLFATGSPRPSES
ncbi:MAG: GNAT family N-acetyltransferase [Thermoanaerobaculia bacterium]